MSRPAELSTPERDLIAQPIRRRLVVMPPGWPLSWLLVGFPIFWALGLSSFAVDIMAIPMALHLLRTRPINLPRGFGFWVLFMLWSLAGILVLGVNPAGTVPDTFESRLISYGVREASYVSITIVLLYVGNLPKLKVPQDRIIRWLGLFFISVVAGGIFGLLAPNFQFTSPFELVLPAGIRTNDYVQHLVHPAAAQVQDLLGDGTPRPAAPFPYTNTWGFHLTLLGVWFCCAWFRQRSALSRLIGMLIFATGATALIFSLNRAAWIGAILAVLYVAVRFALRGRIVPVFAICLVAAVSAGVLFASPLKDVVSGRLQNGKSNDIRSFTTQKALELSIASPVIGFGSTRSTYGSSASIAVGKSAQCPQCGNASIGMNGYLYMLLVSTGYVGVILFFGLWAVQVWRARRLHSPTAIAGSLVLLMTALYGFFYDATTWMLIPFVSVAVLWRERDLSDSVKAENKIGGRV